MVGCQFRTSYFVRTKNGKIKERWISFLKAEENRAGSTEIKMKNRKEVKYREAPVNTLRFPFRLFLAAYYFVLKAVDVQYHIGSNIFISR